MEIYVGNLPPNIQMQELSYLFQYYGRILFIDIKNRCSPLFAFILFDDNGSAFNAVQASQNLVYNGYELQVKLLTEEEPNQSVVEHDKPSNETKLIPQNALPQGCFQQMPLETTQFPNQHKERDKLPGKQKRTPLHRTLTIVEQKSSVVSTGILNVSVKRDKSQFRNKVQRNDIVQIPTIKTLTPEVLNKSVVHKEKSKKKDLKRRSRKILPTPPAGMPGGLDDPYRKGLTGAGIKWYLRYLLSGIPKEEARIKAGVHKYLAKGINEKDARYISERNFNSTFGQK